MSKKSCKIHNRQDFCHQDGNSYEKIQIEACNTRILCLFNEDKENFMIQMDVINSHSKQSCGCLITTEEVGLIISTGANFSIVIGSFSGVVVRPVVAEYVDVIILPSVLEI